MMLIAASWPSNRDAAVTKRNGALSAFCGERGRSLATVLTGNPYKSMVFTVAKILI
jgi:hypothetical protein